MTILQAYYSIFIDAFLNLHVNFRSLNVADTIDFVAYCALTCNGTTLIAEIVRRVILEPVHYQEKLLECHDNMYEFLCYVNHEIMPGSAIGSCTNNRFMYSQGSSRSNWGRDRGMLLKLCQEFYNDDVTVTRQKLMIEKTQKVLHSLVHSKRNGKSEFHGVGAMSANQFLQLASLVGLVPLYCFTVANLHSTKLGPSKAIMKGLNSPKMTLKEIQSCFNNLFDELKAIWGNLVTKSLLENVLCEISRCYNQTTKKYKKSHPNAELPLSIICNTRGSQFCESNAKDIFYFNDAANEMQNMFFVSSGSSGGTTLRPCLLMRLSSTWEKGNESFYNLTNWCQNKADKQMLRWDTQRSRISLDTSLVVSKNLEKLVRISDEN